MAIQGVQAWRVVVFLGLLTGCGTMRGPHVDNERVRALEQELRRRQVEIQDLKERNLVLEKRLSGGGVPPPSPLTQSVVAVAPKPVVAPPSEVPPSPPEPTGDQLLYSKILQTYRKKNLAEMEKSLNLLMKSYPESIYADNALYLGGQLAYELGNFALARQYMDRVLRLYPKGNKAVSAMFAKAMVEKRMARPQEAKRILESLRTMFPGSPESLRVATELKLIDVMSTQKRGM